MTQFNSNRESESKRNPNAPNDEREFKYRTKKEKGMLVVFLNTLVLIRNLSQTPNETLAYR
jgi:hypothetical protein